MPNDTLSPVAMLCLAILFRGDRTGYEIRKESVDGDYKYFAEASYGAIYPALARLAADGHVTVREEHQSGRPSKKIYAITAAGRTALLDLLAEPPAPDIFRSRFLLVAKFAAELPRSVVAAALETRRRTLTEEIAHLEEIAGDEGPAVDWIANYGITCMRASLAYLEAREADLLALAQAPVANAAE